MVRDVGGAPLFGVPPAVGRSWQDDRSFVRIHVFGVGDPSLRGLLPRSAFRDIRGEGKALQFLAQAKRQRSFLVLGMIYSLLSVAR